MNTPRPANRPHDRGYRLLFSHPKMVEDLLRGFIAEPWVDELDFATLTRLPTHYLTGENGNLDERIGDVVWKVEWHSGDGKRRTLYIYIALEFQSTCEHEMALRYLVYVGLFYQQLLKTEPLAPGDLLPPVLPIVLYNGEGAWTAPLDVADLIAEGPGSLKAYRPALRYLLIDERRLPESDLAGLKNVVAALFRLEQSRGPEDVGRVLNDALAWLGEPAQQNLRRDFVLWLSRVLLPARLPGEIIPEVLELADFKTTLEEKMETWTERWMKQGYEQGIEKGIQQGIEKGIQQGIEKGIQQGIEKGIETGIEKGRKQGEATLLVRQLERKFGPLEPSHRRRIAAAGAKRLLEWGERLIMANRLDEVFGI